MINEDYLKENPLSETYVNVLSKLDKKILITNFYVNAVIKLFLYDFRNIMINHLRV